MTTPDQLQNSYERLLYPLLSYRQAHPNRLATVGLLLGMEPAAPDNCRVLELGCASGGHLIPLATSWPNSTFVGVDFGRNQIEEGQGFIQDLGLTNIELIAADVRDIDDSYGQFDYIIAHGLFSWVPEDVRGHILRICKANLAPQGIAYVSYNALPGWHMLKMSREMMLYHTAGIDDPDLKVDAALGLIDFVSQNHTADAPAFGLFFQAYHDLVSHHKKIGGPRHLSSVYHDEMETYNQPYYFSDFMALAQQEGLKYLAEAYFSQVFAVSFAPEVQQRLAELGSGSVVEMEQYMDFIRNRTFRQTLLVHDDAPVIRRLSLRPIVAFLHTTGLAHPDPNTPDGELPTTFVAGEGITFRTDHPVTQAALLYLYENTPKSFNFSELMDAACAKLGIEEAKADDAEALALNILRAYVYSGLLIELEATPAPLVHTSSDQPKTSDTARYFAQLTNTITNRRHERIELDAIASVLIQYVDGNHTKADLIAVLRNMVDTGTMAVNDNDGQPIKDDELIHEILAKQVDLTLEYLRRAALLIA